VDHLTKPDSDELAYCPVRETGAMKIPKSYQPLLETRARVLEARRKEINIAGKRDLKIDRNRKRERALERLRQSKMESS
jgi:hypothetical protein